MEKEALELYRGDALNRMLTLQPIHSAQTLRIHTCGNRRLRFSLSLTTNILRYSQHKVVW